MDMDKIEGVITLIGLIIFVIILNKLTKGDQEPPEIHERW